MKEKKEKKDSFSVIMDFLSPDLERYGDRLEACERLWRGLTRQKQRQIYATLVWQREEGVEIEENPYFAISHCTPRPFNYNGYKGALPTDKRLFIAKYGDYYGLYSKLDVEAFSMEDKRAFS